MAYHTGSHALLKEGIKNKVRNFDFAVNYNENIIEMKKSQR